MLSGSTPAGPQNRGKISLRWLTKLPTSFGFPTDQWTSRRLAALIEQRWGIHFNSNHLVEWLHAREHPPQKPAQPAKERNEEAIARWRDQDWPCLQKKREKKTLIWS